MYSRQLSNNDYRINNNINDNNNNNNNNFINNNENFISTLHLIITYKIKKAKRAFE